MGNSDKDILITPNTGQTAKPKIEVTGANDTKKTIEVNDDGSLTFNSTIAATSGSVANGNANLVTGDAVYDYIEAQNFASAGASNFVVGDITGQSELTSGLQSTDELVLSDGGSLARMDISVLQSYMQSNLNFTTDTVLTSEQVQDIVGAMVDGGTETNIAVTYDDTNAKLNFVSTDTNTQLTQEQVEDFVAGVIVAGSNITKTYDDAAGTLTLAATDTNTQLSTEQVQDIIGAMVSGNTETNIAVTYDDTNGKLDFVSTDTNTQLTLLDEDTMSSNSATAAASQQSIKAYVDSEVAGIVDSAPSALNTLNELAAALGDDASFSTTTATSLGNRLRVDVSNQGLNSTQQGNALTNLGITASLAEINILDDGLAASDIPNLAASKITSGTFATARIADDAITTAKIADDQITNALMADDAIDSAQLADASIDEVHLNATNTAVDNYLLSFDSASGGFTWVAAGAGGENNQTITTGTGIGGANSGSSGDITLTIDSTVATLTGTQTLTNKTLSSPTLTGLIATTLTSGSEQVLISDESDTSLVKIVQTGTGNAFEVHDQASDSSIFAINHVGQVMIKTTTPIAGGLTINDDMYVGQIKSSSSGSASSPRYTFNSDSNTGMYHGGADILKFSTGGTERLSLSSSGVQINSAYTFPTSDGSANQVLVTDGSGTLSFAAQTDTNTQLSTEQVQDIVGAMFSSNTETRISATYQDGDGTIDLVVDDMTANTQLTLLDQDDMSSNSATAAASQQSIKAYVDAEVAGLVDSAPSALNTLNELAAALGDDANFSTTTATSLGNRLRVDVNNQGLNSTQQGNALTNLGITASLAEINILDDGLSASDIPNLATSKITSGTFDDGRIAQSNVTQHLAVGSGGGIGLSGKTFSLDIDGMTDIGAALVDADLMIVDDGAGGTNRKATMSRLKTYMQNNLTFTTNTDTQLSNEQVQDIAGPLVATGGTKTRISVTYDDTNNNMDFVVDDMNFSVNDITGATSLTSGLASTDEFVINDAGVLKRMDVSVLQSYMQSNLSLGGDVVDDTSPQLGGDLDVNGNKITSASNADVTIEPNGTGDINLYADTVIAGDASTDFKLQHRTKTNSFLTFLNNGNNQLTADANIYINADEAGNGGSLIRLNAITSQLGKANTNAVLTTQGTGDLTLSTNGGTNSGTIVIADGANSDIGITPNGTGKVVIGSTTSEHDSLSKLTIKGSDAGMLIEKHDDGSSGGPTLALYRYSASVADSDLIGQVNFRGEGSTGNPSTYISLRTEIEDTTEGSKDGKLIVRGLKANSQTDFMSVGSTGVEFEGGARVGEVTDVTIGSGTSGTTTGFRLGANQEAGMVAGEVSSQSTANDGYIELMNMDLDAITGASGLQTIELTVQIEDETNEEVESFKALVQATEKTVLGTTVRAVNFTEWAILYDGAARIGTLAADYDSSDDTIRIRYQNKQGSTATLTATFYAITMQNNT